MNGDVLRQRWWARHQSATHHFLRDAQTDHSVTVWHICIWSLFLVLHASRVKNSSLTQPFNIHAHLLFALFSIWLNAICISAQRAVFCSLSSLWWHDFPLFFFCFFCFLHHEAGVLFCFFATAGFNVRRETPVAGRMPLRQMKNSSYSSSYSTALNVYVVVCFTDTFLFLFFKILVMLWFCLFLNVFYDEQMGPTKIALFLFVIALRFVRRHWEHSDSECDYSRRSVKMSVRPPPPPTSRLLHHACCFPHFTVHLSKSGGAGMIRGCGDRRDPGPLTISLTSYTHSARGQYVSP